MRPSLLKTLGVLAWAAALVGCATGSKQDLISDTHKRVVSLDKNLGGSVAKLNETAAELVARVNESEQQTRAIQSKLDENQMKLDALQRKLDQFQALFCKVAGVTGPSPSASSGSEVRPAPVGQTEITPPTSAPLPPPPAKPEGGNTPLTPLTGMEGGVSPPPPPPPPPPPAVPSAGNAEADYAVAQKSYANNDFNGALQQFGEFLQRYPGSENGGNAQFWKAKSLQSLERYQEAIQEFEKVQSAHASHVKVPYALHQEAVCHARLGQTDRAVQLLQKVIKEYPTTPAADQAKTDLKKLQAPGR